MYIWLHAVKNVANVCCVIFNFEIHKWFYARGIALSRKNDFVAQRVGPISQWNLLAQWAHAFHMWLLLHSVSMTLFYMWFDVMQFYNFIFEVF
jgi:hypothetical protein